MRITNPEKPRGGIVIVTPALADANNGNWRTARRWQGFLAALHPVRLSRDWPDAKADGDQAMIALHARRSAPAIAAWHARHGNDGLAVVLTGTDLYRDIGTDGAARASLDYAQALVVLQECGPGALPENVRPRARVIFQSGGVRQPLAKTRAHVRALMVGHLRAEKSPDTLFAAARRLARERGILIDHVGTALDPALAELARATMAECPAYRWLGGLPHAATRRRIQRAHVLVHPSRMEGGAHVVLEAVASGTPVLASRIDGNVGMLGADYEGYFPWGDDAALAELLRECRASLGRADGLLARLTTQCNARAPLFSTARERLAVRQLAAHLVQGGP